MDLHSRLNYLFGTEEYVRKRRRVVLLTEKLLEYGSRPLQTRVICSGSIGEGVAYPKSDDDIMGYGPYSCVVREPTQRGDLLMVPSENSAGYCLLQDIDRSHNKIFICTINKIPFLSSSLWKKMGLKDGEIIHGPCFSKSGDSFEYDYAYCVPCCFWPDVANDWVIRNRSYGWPSHEIIQDIFRGGCLVMPVGDPYSPFGQHEWRISFSVPERKLMHSFNHTQFLTYNLLRLTLKRIIEKRVPGVLCSYFMKTTLFYSAEKTSTQLWQMDHIERGFKACLSVLIDFVDHINCPNYFIPDYNMLKRKVNHTNRHQVLDLIKYLYTIGIIGIIHLGGESRCLYGRLSLPMMEWESDTEFFNSIFNFKIIMLMQYLILIKRVNQSDIFSMLYKIVHILQENVLNGQKEIFNLYFRLVFTCYSEKLMNTLVRLPRNNKRNYHLNKTIQSLLRLGKNVDVTTGKLKAATYMYLTGRTECALSIIRKLLSEHPPYVIDDSPNTLKMSAYMYVMCNKGYTIDYKARLAFAPKYLLKFVSMDIFPFPLRIWISITQPVVLDPLSYAFVLESLCHIRLHNNILLLKSTRCLINSIHERRDHNDNATVRMCMGIVKYAQGDNQLACRWFGSAYVMKNTLTDILKERFPRSALTYIACLLNKQLRSENRIL